jgi:hypothetical protein
MYCSKTFFICTLLLGSSLIAMEESSIRKSGRKRTAPQRFNDRPADKKRKLTAVKPKQKKARSEKPVPFVEGPVPFHSKSNRYLINPYEHKRHEDGTIENPLKHEQRCYLDVYGRDSANHISAKDLAKGLAHKEKMRALAGFVDHEKEAEKHVYEHIKAVEEPFFGFSCMDEVFALDTFTFNQDIKTYSLTDPKNRRYLKDDGTYGYHR